MITGIDTVAMSQLLTLDKANLCELQPLCYQSTQKLPVDRITWRETHAAHSTVTVDSAAAANRVSWISIIFWHMLELRTPSASYVLCMYYRFCIYLKTSNLNQNRSLTYFKYAVASVLK